MHSITCSVVISFDSFVGCTVVGLIQTELMVFGAIDDVGSGGTGPTISAGSMLPRRVPFFNTCSRSAVFGSHIRKSENLAGKTLRPLYTLLTFGILMFSVTPTNARSRRS